MRKLTIRRSSDSGQTLPLFVLAVFVIFAAVAFVIDGGNVFAQQRVAQNAVDAAAMAGAIEVSSNLEDPGSRTDADVASAVNQAIAQTAASGADGVDHHQALYTDGFGKLLAGPVAVGEGTLPSDARGVNVIGTRDVQTTFARLPPISINTFAATAEATAITGVFAGACPVDTPCVVLPVTMPVSYLSTICDEDLASLGIAGPQVSWTLINDPSEATTANVSVLPLCITGSGDFSWLDLGGGNLANQIEDPSNQDFWIPDWIQTQTGNPNSLEVQNAINAYIDQIVQVPMWQAVCRNDPGGIDDPCTDPGVNGNNTYYAIPYMRPLLLEGAYINGDNRADCSVPGVTWPEETGPGSVPGLVGCIKGWWMNSEVVGGPVDPNRPIGENATLGVQLIK